MAESLLSLCTIPGYPGYYLDDQNNVWSSKKKLGTLRMMSWGQLKGRQLLRFYKGPRKFTLLSKTQICSLAARGSLGYWIKEPYGKFVPLLVTVSGKVYRSDKWSQEPEAKPMTDNPLRREK